MSAIKKLCAYIKARTSSTDENNQIIVRNIFWSFTIRGGALLISLFTMPAFMRYFENQQVLGVWFTVLSVITWILNFDLGIGNGLRNHLVAAIAEKNHEDIQKLISSAYLMIGGITGLSIVIGYFISPFISWNAIFNVPTATISTAVMLRVVRCVFMGIMLQFFLRLISSVLYALQKSALNNAIALLISLLQLFFVLLAPSTTPENNLVLLSFAYIFFANVPLLIATIAVFSTKLRGCFPSFRTFKLPFAKKVLSLGGVFFLCQILYMIIMNTNEFFISHYISATDVVDYQVYQRLFSLAGSLLTLALAPIWSAATKAMAELNFVWLESIYKKLLKLSLLIALAEFAMIPFLQLIVNLWLGENAIHINIVYALIYACFGSVFIYHTVLSTIVCGIGQMKLQACFYFVGVIFKFAFIHFTASLYPTWIIVTIANILVLLPYCIAQQVELKRYFGFHIRKRKEENLDVPK